MQAAPFWHGALEQGPTSHSVPLKPVGQVHTGVMPLKVQEAPFQQTFSSQAACRAMIKEARVKAEPCQPANQHRCQRGARSGAHLHAAVILGRPAVLARTAGAGAWAVGGTVGLGALRGRQARQGKWGGQVGPPHWQPTGLAETVARQHAPA